MSSVHQYQRRALESLSPDKKNSLTVSKSENNTYYLDGIEIFLAGISPGAGTCADLHEINIAVFGDSPPEHVQFPRGLEIATCEWSALVRLSTDEEKQVWFQKNGNTCCLTALSIEFVKKIKKKNNTTFYFTIGKDKKIYADTI